jgi:HEAT repeat protein
VSGSKWHYFTANADYVVELRGAIAMAIPSLIKLLEDKDKGVQRKAAEVIGHLANHGE